MNCNPPSDQRDREDYYQCDCTGSKCELDPGLADDSNTCGVSRLKLGFGPRHRKAPQV